jgi:hypothetical protein
MATEGPLTHDGSQTTANSDLSTGKNGQNGSGQFLAVKLVGARLVDLCTANTDFAYGILQNKPAAGQAADVGIMGVSKAVAGGTVAAGDMLTANSSGQLVTAATTNARIAQALEAAAPSTIFTVAIIPGPLARDAA